MTSLLLLLLISSYYLLFIILYKINYYYFKYYHALLTYIILYTIYYDQAQQETRRFGKNMKTLLLNSQYSHWLVFGKPNRLVTVVRTSYYNHSYKHSTASSRVRRDFLLLVITSLLATTPALPAPALPAPPPERMSTGRRAMLMDVRRKLLAPAPAPAPAPTPAPAAAGAVATGTSMISASVGKASVT
jgi:hypothetical protein